MEKTNYEWLISKLRKAETERDAAIEHAKMVELDNLRLRVKLRSISDYAGTSRTLRTCYPTMRTIVLIFPKKRRTKAEFLSRKSRRTYA